MDENTRLLSDTSQHKIDDDNRHQRRETLNSKNRNFRASSVPPNRPFKDPADIDGDVFHSSVSQRPRTSLGYGTTDGTGSSTINENRDTSEQEAEQDGKDKKQEKTQWLNIFLLNIILIIWSIAGKIHGPVVSQYLYRRVLDEVFGNSTLPGTGNSSQVNNTVCYKPTVNHSADHNHSYSLQEQAQELTAEINMKFSMCTFAFNLVSTIMIGSYSDYIGRRILFLVPLFGHFVDYSVAAMIIYWKLDMNYFYIASVTSGICTSELFSIACDVYVTENTPPKASRTMGLTIISVVDALTTAALSTGVGYYIQLEGFFLPSVTSIGIIVVDLIAVIFILPKPKPNDPKKQNNALGKPNLNPLKALKNVFGFYLFEGTSKSRSMFLMYFLAFIFYTLSSNMGNIDTLWMMNYPLCWTPEMMGYYGTASTIVGQTIKVPLLKLMQCCINDRIIAIFSNIMIAGSLILKAFALTNMLMYGVILISALSVAVTSVIKSELSEMAGEHRLGSLFAGLGMVNIICGMVGTPVFTEIYKYTLNMFRGTSYLVSAGCQCVSTILLVIYVILWRVDNQSRKKNIDLLRTNTIQDQA